MKPESYILNLEKTEDMLLLIWGKQSRRSNFDVIYIFRVLACVTAQAVRPFPDRPLEGTLGVYVELGPLAMSAEDYQ